MATKYLLLSDYVYLGSTWRAGKVISSNHFNITQLVNDGCELTPYTGTIPKEIQAAQARASQGNAPSAELRGYELAGLKNEVVVFDTVALAKAGAKTLKDYQLCYVKTLDRYFTWVLASTATVDGYVCFADTDSTGMFETVPGCSLVALDQTTWYISALGDDEGTGSVSSPLATFKEWLTRTGGHFKDGTTINLVPDPDGSNEWTEEIVGSVYAPYAGAVLNILGSLRTVSTKSAVTIADGVAATNTMFKITKAIDWSSFVGSLFAKDANTMTWGASQATNDLFVKEWFDPAAVTPVATPTATTSVLEKGLTDSAGVTLHMHGEGQVVCKYFAFVSALHIGKGARFVCCYFTEAEVVEGSPSFQHCYVEQLNVYAPVKVDIVSSVLQGVDSIGATWNIDGMVTTGNLLFAGGYTTLTNNIWGKAITGSLYTANKMHMVDCSAGVFSGAGVESVFAINTGSKLVIDAAGQYIAGSTQDFIIDGATSHVPPLAGGELAVPASASCKTWAELTGSPFSNTVQKQGTGSSVQAV